MLETIISTNTPPNDASIARLGYFDWNWLRRIRSRPQAGPLAGFSHGLLWKRGILWLPNRAREPSSLVLEKLTNFPRLQRIWADGAYAGKLVDWAKELGQWILEIIKRSDEALGFEVLPHRWIVERTFAWFGRFRRLSKDYEVLVGTSEAMIRVAMIRLMIRRLATAS